jgi:hypothetical protein
VKTWKPLERKCACPSRQGLGHGRRRTEPPDGTSKEKLVGIELDGKIVFGYPASAGAVETLKVIRVTPRGRTTPATGRDATVNLSIQGLGHHNLRPVLRWNGGPVGIAETHYPHPSGWTFAETANPRATLEHMTVRRLTALFRAPHLEDPACVAKWQELYGPIEFVLVWAQFTNPLVSPRDFKSAFRIVHRSLFLRFFNPAAPDSMCRLCRCAPERFSHLAECEYIRDTFDFFVAFASQYMDTEAWGNPTSPLVVYLGMVDGTTPLPGAMAALRVIVWKFALIAMVKVDTEGAKYEPERVWKGALRRFQTRVLRYDTYVARLFLRQACFGRAPPNPARHSAVLAPIQGYDVDGTPLRRSALAAALDELE